MLGLSLRLAVSSVVRRIAQIGDVAEDLLLTQAEDNIILQNGNFLVRVKPPASLILTQTGDFLVTQADEFIETSSS